VLTEALEAGRRMRELQRVSPALWGLAELAVVNGDAPAALRWSEEGRAASALVDDAAYLFPFLVTGTRAHLAAGDPRGADRWVAEVSASLRRRSIPGTLPAIDHALGLVAMASGSTGRARELLTRAILAWDERKRIWDATLGRLDLAACHLRANRPLDAARLADEVRARAAELPAPPLADRANEIRRTSRQRGPVGEAWAPLTAREFAVARLIAEGRTNAEIAAELAVAPKTVSAHVEHILAKLAIGRRAEIAAWATTIQAGRPPGPSAAATADQG
jgi:DNA-binding CsgD family transcriptional regulator